MASEATTIQGGNMTLTLDAAHAKVSEMIGAIPTALTEYRCTLCTKVFGSYSDLKQHYEVAHLGAVPPITVVLTLNGKSCETLIEPHWTLKRTLQFRLGLTGAKHMCDKGVCGSCTVIMDGRAVLACQMLAVECEGHDIQTIEGIAADAKWKPLIDAYCRWDAMQCGYCTTGFLVSAKHLLDKNPDPTEQECREALAGNICICGTYPRHAQAILEAAKIIANPPPPPPPPGPPGAPQFGMGA
ncbi:MAG: (2Fe-2S)-binding protein [Oscillospiraceae bacterium]|jgi:xanthine dehydrogenase YagT iron-sulfur-binding subunit|nr:(2Fe-2S)-binding protein [Oscillospiraceae bacterium]